MKPLRRLLAGTVGWLALSTAAFGYYHFVHYGSRTAPFNPIYEKFDLNSLSNKTLYYFIPDQPAVQFAAGDSATSLSSQIRAAAKVWNDVDTSDLRLAYGGSANTGLPQSTPGIDVVFEELPPGVLAMGGPTRRSGLSGTGQSAFIPITRSVLLISSNLTQRPSFSDDFFLTAVHELGHALGLQHTFTSAAMSTALTRSTSKAHPLDTDDIAGISLLYPTASFKQSTGSVTGRVTSAGQGVNLASVVVISAGGPAISALTNPDGTYRVDGIPPGGYFVYVHPLPLPEGGQITPGDISSQWDPDGNQSFAFSVGPNVSFSAQFFPGVKDWHSAAQIAVNPGQSVDGVNFGVQPIARNPFISVYTYGYPGNYAVQPPYINFNGGRQLMIAGGSGLITNGVPTPGLSAGVLGNVAAVPPNSPRTYTPDYMLVDFQEPQPVPAEGPRHLVFTLNNEIYVLPAAFHAVHRQPPLITGMTQSIDAAGRPLVSLTGSNLGPDTRVWFDGLPGQVVDSSLGVLKVFPPLAPSGHRATVVALNGDGQTSMFLQAQAPPVYQYDIQPLGTDTPFLAVSTNALMPGTETLIEIAANGTPFVDGSTTLGFGSSDVVVKRFWVTNNGSRILANVFVAPDAASSFLNLNVVTGLRTLIQPFVLQTVPPANPGLFLTSNLLNLTWNSNTANPGSTVLLQVPALTNFQIQNGLVLTLGNVPVTSYSATPGQITFTVPNIASGPAVLRLQAGGEQASIVLQVDPIPANIISITLNNFPVDQNRGVRNGDTLVALLSGYGDLGAQISSTRVRVTIGGVDQQVTQVTQISSSPGLQTVQFFVNGAQTGQQNVSISFDNKPAAPLSVSVR